MRVVLVSDCFLPEINGISFCVKNLAEGLSKKHGVKVIAPDYGGEEEKGDAEWGVEVVRFKSVHVPLDQKTRWVWPNRGKMKRLLAAFRPEIVHCHTMGGLGWLAMGVGRELGIKTVLTYHTLVAQTLASYPGFKWAPRLTESLMWMFSRAQCERGDGLIVPALAVAEELKRHGVNKKITVIANGVETEKFRRWGKPQRYRLAYAGRIGFEKGVEVVLEAFGKIKSRLPEASWHLAGTGPAVGELKARVEREKIEGVYFWGQVERDRLAEFYSRAEIFVTAARYEVNPLAVLEAMACGLPVVGVDSGGMKCGPVRSGENGVLVREPRAEVYARVISELLVDRDRLRRMSQAARATAERYSAARMVEKTARFYARICDGVEKAG